MKEQVLEILERMINEAHERLEELETKPISPASKAMMKAHLVGQIAALVKLKLEIEALFLFNNKK